MTSVCATKFDLPYLVNLRHILPWHYPVVPLPGLALPILVSLALSRLFPVVCLACPIFASILANFVLATVLIRSCRSLALICPYSSGPALAIQFQGRADLS